MAATNVVWVLSVAVQTADWAGERRPAMLRQSTPSRRIAYEFPDRVSGQCPARLSVAIRKRYTDGAQKLNLFVSTSRRVDANDTQRFGSGWIVDWGTARVSSACARPNSSAVGECR